MRQIRRCPEVGKPAAVEPHPAVPDRRLAAARVWQTAGWSGKPPFTQEPSDGSISDRCPLAPGLDGLLPRGPLFRPLQVPQALQELPNPGGTIINHPPRAMREVSSSPRAMLQPLCTTGPAVSGSALGKPEADIPRSGLGQCSSGPAVPPGCLSGHAGKTKLIGERDGRCAGPRVPGLTACKPASDRRPATAERCRAWRRASYRSRTWVPLPYPPASSCFTRV